MRTVNFFVASSVVEFEAERQQLGDFVLSLNKKCFIVSIATIILAVIVIL